MHKVLVALVRFRKRPETYGFKQDVNSPSTQARSPPFFALRFVNYFVLHLLYQVIWYRSGRLYIAGTLNPVRLCLTPKGKLCIWMSREGQIIDIWHAGDGNRLAVDREVSERRRRKWKDLNFAVLTAFSHRLSEMCLKFWKSVMEVELDETELLKIKYCSSKFFSGFKLMINNWFALRLCVLNMRKSKRDHEAMCCNSFWVHVWLLLLPIELTLHTN